MVRSAVAQKGLSPKLLADLIVSVITFAVAYFGIDLEPEAAAAIGKLVGFVAGVLVKPGKVIVEPLAPVPPTD